MSSADDAPAASPTVEEALHAKLEMPFDEAVDRVQLEHELAGFESIKTTRVDKLIKGALEEEVERAALVVVCHAQVAMEALEIDRSLAGMLPCTTAVYEVPDDDCVHVHHVSVTKAIRDLGCTDDEAAIDDLVALTGERMSEVWAHVEDLAVDD
jgi:uncharacterized protein (DUF302 family)